MNNRGETDFDVVLLVITITNLIVSAWIFNHWWGIAITGFMLWLALTEAGSKLRQRLTLTQKFKRADDWKKWYFFGSLNLFWFYLNIHLLLKVGIWE